MRNKRSQRTLRRKTYRAALDRTAKALSRDLYVTANSYFGMLRQCPQSHHDRARLAKIVMRRGNTMSWAFTQTFRSNCND